MVVAAAAVAAAAGVEVAAAAAMAPESVAAAATVAIWLGRSTCLRLQIQYRPICAMAHRKPCRSTVLKAVASVVIHPRRRAPSW